MLLKYYVELACKQISEITRVPNGRKILCTEKNNSFIHNGRILQNQNLQSCKGIKLWNAL